MKKIVAWMLAVGMLLSGGTKVRAGELQVDAVSGTTLILQENSEAKMQESDSEASQSSGASEPAAAQDAVELVSPHAAVMEVSTGQILYEKGADEKAHPASVTKVMTTLLIFEALEEGNLTLDQEVSTSAHAKSMGGSQVFLEEGEIQTVETLLKCIIIASGNDAAVAMAEQIGGTEEAFVARMNEKAKSLGMSNTHFVDCCGLTDSTDHYTTARDVAIMSRELLHRFPQVVEYSNIWMEDITHVTNRGSSVFTLSNTNKLLRAYDGCDGLKTGSTSLAKFCLSATARRNGIRLVSVIMTSPDSKTRFAEAGKLLSYGFSRCSLYEDEEMEPLGELAVQGGVEDTVKVKYQSGFSYLSTTGEDFSAISRRIELEQEVRAPLALEQQVGACIYTIGEKEIGRVAIVTEAAVEKAGYLDWLDELWSCWLL